MTRSRFVPGQLALLEPPSTGAAYAGPLPRLRGVRVGIDTETRDDGLAREMGPGWVYDMGHLCGVSVAWGREDQVYVAVRHPDTECRPVPEVVEWIEHLLRECECVFHNMAYDMGWLRHAGVQAWPARAHDTHAMAVLLDENWDSYSLDACCRRAGVQGKDERGLREAAAAHGCDPKQELWRLPARHVAAYAEQDARATLDLAEALLPALAAEGLEDAYRTEIELMPATHAMRARGIRMSDEAAAAAQAELGGQRDQALADIRTRTGVRVSMLDMRSPDALGRLLDAEGIQYPLTPKTRKPSITREWLEQHDHWLPRRVREARQFDDLDRKFVGTYILQHAHRGRVHAEIHQLRDETGGTRTWRLSYSNPPLQQMPARPDPRRPETVRLIRLLRAIFLPEEGCLWAAPDYNQQEFRLAVHFASVASILGAEDAVRYYCERLDDADFHAMVMLMTGLPRPDAKIINFGLMFGMGREKLIRSLGLSDEDGEEMLRTYHSRLPWIHGLSDFCSGRAQRRGWIRLIDGCRCHFDQWQPRGSRSDHAVRREAAERTWPGRRLERAFCHKAMNRAIQGSAARQMKLAMAQCHREGLGLLLQLHDELGVSVDNPRDALRAAEIMETVVRLRVPVRVDLELGKNWGDAKHSLEEMFGDTD